MNRSDICRFAANLLVRLVTMCTSWFLWALERLAGRYTSRASLLRLLPVLVLSTLGAELPGSDPNSPSQSWCLARVPLSGIGRTTDAAYRWLLPGAIR